MRAASAEQSDPLPSWNAEREFEYRVSPMGHLEAALAEAHERNWTVVSMRRRLEAGLCLRARMAKPKVAMKRV